MIDTGIYSNLTVGIVSGLLASLIMVFLLGIYRSIFIPFLQKLLYYGVNINGKWQVSSDYEYAEEKLIFDIHHTASQLCGHAVIVKQFSKSNSKVKKNTEIVIATIEGTIKDRFVRINLEFQDNKRLGLGSYLLEIIADGSVMKGVSVWYDTGFSTIKSKDVICNRYYKKNYFSSEKFEINQELNKSEVRNEKSEP